MNENLEIDGLTANYTLKRIVFINSAGHAYSEFLLDQHLAMFGRNNAGKTASLAATKLMLFPEVNFRKCAEKFRFMGKKGSYDGEDSFDFYFPSSNSFMVMEVEKDKGNFCMVLYRHSSASSLSYHRIFLSLPYADIQHLFWNLDQESHPEGMCLTKLLEFSKANRGTLVNDEKELAELMYGNFGRADSLYCVVPLLDSRKESIDAFRSIYQLAFDSSDSETTTLPEAIAAIIEMHRSHDRERLDTRLPELRETYMRLRQESRWLDTLEENEDDFIRLRKNYYEVIEQVTTYSHNIHCASHTLIHMRNEIAPRHKSLSEQLQLQLLQITELNKTIQNKEKVISTAQGALDQQKKELKVAKDKLAKAQQVIGEYPADYGIEKIISTLKSHLMDRQTMLTALNSREAAEKKKKELVQEKLDLDRKIRELMPLIENEQHAVLFQLHNQKSASVLYTLNAEFGLLNSPLNDADREIISAFTELFDIDSAQYLTFKDKSFSQTKYSPYDPKKLLEEQQAQLLDLQNQTSDKWQEIQQLQLTLDKFNDKDHINSQKLDLELEIKRTESDLDLLDRYPALNKDVPELTMFISTSEEIQISHQEEHVRLIGQQTDTQDKLNRIQSEISELNQLITTMDRIQAQLKNAFSVQQPLPSTEKDKEIDESLLTPTFAEQIFDQANGCKTRAQELRDHIRSFMAKVALPDGSDLQHRESLSMSDLGIIVDQYSGIFDSLNYLHITHKNNIRTHNSDLNSQLDEIKDAYTILTNQVNLINRKLNSNPISNLSSIELILDISTDFQDLHRVVVEKYDPNSNALLSEDFYDRLLQYAGNHSNTKGLLRMRDLIRKISYSYTIKNSDESVTKSQSGGTTSTITSFVLSVLLKQILMANTHLKLPIIVDEVGTLDDRNTNATINQISSHGFSIFCATPLYTAVVARSVGHSIIIDRHKIKQPIQKGCEMINLPEHIRHYGMHHED